MAQDAAKRQGGHAGLIRAGPFGTALKHFCAAPWEMLQEIRTARVDLGLNRP
jgi:hypothetical protein